MSILHRLKNETVAFHKCIYIKPFVINSSKNTIQPLPAKDLKPFLIKQTSHECMYFRKGD